MKIKTIVTKETKCDEKNGRKLLPSQLNPSTSPSALPKCVLDVQKSFPSDTRSKCHLPSRMNSVKESVKPGKKKLVKKEELPTKLTKILLPGKKAKAFKQQKVRRVHRMASLNALAKVHILYENECRGSPNEPSESDSNPEFKSLPVEKKMVFMPAKIDSIKKEPKQTEVLHSKEIVKVKPSGIMFKKGKRGKVKVKTRKRKVLDDVEIIDTRVCKRLASLNAQAILAASYSPERAKREKKQCKIDAITVDNKEIVTVVDQSITTTQVTNQMCTIITQKPSSKETNVVHHNNIRSSARDPKIISNVHNKNKQRVSMEPRVKKIGLSAYTEVTKVHINTTKAMQLKQEGKRILEKDNVAIMYRYQSTKGTRQRYCMEMHTSYKPNKSITPPSKQETPPHVSMHGQPPPGSGYYHGYGPPNMVTHMGKNYTTPNRVNGVPMVAMSRHYGSAFTVPHYGVPPHGTPQHVTYPNGTEFAGYYQPQGPMAQPVHDPCLIHKPVAYHPQHLGSGGSTPTTPSHPSPAHHPPLHTHPPPPLSSQPPPAHAGYPPPESPCMAHSGGCHTLESMGPYPQPGPMHPSGYPPSTPYHCQGAVQAPCVYSPPGSYQDYGPSSPPTYQVLSPMAPNQSPPHQQQQQASSPHPLSLAQKRVHTPPRPATGNSVAVPKTEPTTPPEIKPLSPNGFIGDNGSYNVFQQADFPPTTLDDSISSVKEIFVSTSRCSKQTCPPKPVESDNRTSEPPTVTSEVQTNGKGVTRLVNSQPIHRQRVRKQCDPLQRDEMCRKLRSTSSSAARQAEIRRNIQVAKQKLKDTAKDTTKEKPPTEVKESKRPVVAKETTLQAVKRLKKNSGSSCSSQSESPKEVEVVSLLPTSPSSALLGICPNQHALLSKKKGPKKFSNGWTWEGEPFDKLVFLSNDDSPCLRRCFPCMRHIEGDTIQVRDCVLLRSGPRKTDLPFVAKVAALWETPEEEEMMMSLMWYYRPEHTEQGRRAVDMEDEIFASKHRDANSVACIEDKCYVLTFTEYCRYRGRIRLLEESSTKPLYSMVPQPEEGYPRKLRMPPGRVAPEMVFFCRKVYDFRQKRILKNPV